MPARASCGRSCPACRRRPARRGREPRTRWRTGTGVAEGAASGNPQPSLDCRLPAWTPWSRDTRNSRLTWIEHTLLLALRRASAYLSLRRSDRTRSCPPFCETPLSETDAKPRKLVREFRQILVWPIQLMPLREGAQIQEHWEALSQLN